MGRSRCCEKAHTNKGAWTKEEDFLLISHIRLHGEGCWRSLPQAAGLFFLSFFFVPNLNDRSLDSLFLFVPGGKKNKRIDAMWEELQAPVDQLPPARP